MPRWILAITIISALSCIAAGALAQSEETPATPGVGDLTADPEGAQSVLDAGVGFSRVSEDSYIDFNLGFSFSITKLTIGLLLPLRFRVIDEDPQDDGVIRSNDWDEPGDYLRILRFVQWGQRRDPIYVRAGELVGVSMGHGTIVNGYNNNLDVNHFAWGINGALNLAWGGTELLFDDVADPGVMGLRAYVRPWVFIDPESFWTRLAFGMSLIGDVDAPTELLLDDEGLYIFDSADNIQVADSQATGILGVDVEMQVFTNDLVSITPYTDVNFHLGQGTGYHLGTLTNFTFTENFALNTRFEFRVLGEGYEPSYFDGLYEVERFLFLPLDATGQRRPKLQVIEALPPESRVGWYGELTFSIFNAILLTGAYENYQGEDNSSSWLRLSLPQLGPVRLGAYYINQNFDGISELFDLDNALFVSEARVNVSGPFYLIGQYSRRWSAQPDGTYEPVDDWGVGMGVSFAF